MSLYEKTGADPCVEEVNMSAGCVKANIHNELKSSKVSTRWVPKQLSNEQMEKCVKVCTQLLEVSRRMVRTSYLLS
jgi:hypothetical protein